jgi:hypothetical protein
MSSDDVFLVFTHDSNFRSSPVLFEKVFTTQELADDHRDKLNARGILGKYSSVIRMPLHSMSTL